MVRKIIYILYMPFQIDERVRLVDQPSQVGTVKRLNILGSSGSVSVKWDDIATAKAYFGPDVSKIESLPE